MTISSDALIALTAAWTLIQVTGLTLKHRATQRTADRKAAAPPKPPKETTRP